MLNMVLHFKVVQRLVEVVSVDRLLLLLLADVVGFVSDLENELWN